MTELERFYRRHAEDVHRFCFWLCGDAAEADDMTSETFIRAWAGPAAIRTETARACLLAIARNLCRRRGRRSARITELSPEIPDPAPGPDANTAARAELARALGAMQQLPEIDRTALLMRVEQGLPCIEIARALGISTAAARVKVHRARYRLRRTTGRGEGE